MSFIDFGKNFSDVQEKKAVVPGVYHLTVESVADHQSKETGKPSIKVQLKIEGHDDAPLVTEFLSLPTTDDEPEKVLNKMIRIKRFLVAFNVPHEDNGFNQEDMFGCSADIELTQTDPEESDTNEVYNRCKLPKLPDEGAAGDARASRGTAKSAKKR